MVLVELEQGPDLVKDVARLSEQPGLLHGIVRHDEGSKLLQLRILVVERLAVEIVIIVVFIDAADNLELFEVVAQGGVMIDECGIVLLLTMYGLKADGVRDGKLVEEFEEAQTAGVIIDSLVIGKELGDETAVREIIVGTYAVVLDSGLGVNYEHQLSDATLVHGAHFLLSGRAARHDVINLASGIIDHKTMESLSHGDVAKVGIAVEGGGDEAVGALGKAVHLHDSSLIEVVHGDVRIGRY